MAGKPPRSDAPMLTWALYYASLGWHVFPLRTSGDVKRPNQILGGLKDGGHTLATTDQAVIRGWWGDVPTAGIGVWLAASRLIVVDVDPRNGGDATLTRLEAVHGPLEPAVEGLTGGGGRHLFYSLPAGVTSPPGRLGPPKGGIDLKFNGYVVLPPSKWARRDPDDPNRAWLAPSSSYRWHPERGPDDADWLSDLPKWCLESSESALVATNKPLSDDIFAHDNSRLGLTNEQIRRELFLIPNGGKDNLDYDDWQNCGFAVWHETGGSDFGRELFLEWSEQSDKHVIEEFDKKWPSFDPEDTLRQITFRFVMKLSKPHKEREQEDLVNEFKIDIGAASSVPMLIAVSGRVKKVPMHQIHRAALTGAFQDRIKALTGRPLAVAEARRLTRYEDPGFLTTPEWADGFAYITRYDEFVRVGTSERLSRASLRGAFDAQMLTDAEKAEGAAVPAIHADDLLLNRVEIPKYFDELYWPGRPEEFDFKGATCLNRFSTRGQPPVPGKIGPRGRAAIERVKAHMTLLAPREGEREIIYDAFAHIVQTHGRLNWAIVLQGAEGAGKSFVTSFLGAILGADNVRPMKAGTIVNSNFSEWAEGSLVNCVEEVKVHDEKRKKLTDSVQTFISNPEIEVNVKFKNARVVPNATTWLFYTNDPDSLALSPGDRRYFMVASSIQTETQAVAFDRANPTYYATLFALLDDPTTLGALRKWLLDREISPSFNPKGRAPRSEARDDAVLFGKNEVTLLIEEVLAEEKPGLNEELISLERLTAVLINRTENILGISTNRLSYSLRQMRFTPLGRHRTEKGRDGRRETFMTLRRDLYADDQATQTTQIRERLAGDRYADW